MYYLYTKTIYHYIFYLFLYELIFMLVRNYSGKLVEFTHLQVDQKCMPHIWSPRNTIHTCSFFLFRKLYFYMFYVNELCIRIPNTQLVPKNPIPVVMTYWSYVSFFIIRILVCVRCYCVSSIVVGGQFHISRSSAPARAQFRAHGVWWSHRGFLYVLLNRLYHLI